MRITRSEVTCVYCGETVVMEWQDRQRMGDDHRCPDEEAQQGWLDDYEARADAASA